MKEIFLGVRETEEMRNVAFLDDQIAANSEVDNGGGNVAHIDGIVDECADFTGGELFWGLILRGDGTKCGITAASPPPPKHDRENQDRDDERPVATQVEKEQIDARRFSQRAFVASDRNGKTFTCCQRGIGLNIDATADDIDGGILSL